MLLSKYFNVIDITDSLFNLLLMPSVSAEYLRGIFIKVYIVPSKVGLFVRCTLTYSVILILSHCLISDTKINT
jgi:hypothetical protein